VLLLAEHTSVGLEAYTSILDMKLLLQMATGLNLNHSDFTSYGDHDIM